MRSSEDFRTTIRRGSKAAQPTLVTHVLLHAGDETSVGFVVSKAVGTAVERNQVKRRLRHLMQERIERLPRGSRVVVRALPAASGTSSLSLAEHLDRALTRSGAL